MPGILEIHHECGILSRIAGRNEFCDRTIFAANRDVSALRNLKRFAVKGVGRYLRIQGAFGEGSIDGYDDKAEYLNGMLFKPLPALCLFIVGCLILAYGWVKFRTDDGWWALAGLSISVIGFLVVMLATGCYLAYDRDRIMNEPFDILQFRNDLLRECGEFVIHASSGAAEI